MRCKWICLLYDAGRKYRKQHLSPRIFSLINYLGSLAIFHDSMLELLVASLGSCFISDCNRPIIFFLLSTQYFLYRVMFTEKCRNNVNYIYGKRYWNRKCDIVTGWYTFRNFVTFCNLQSLQNCSRRNRL